MQNLLKKIERAKTLKDDKEKIDILNEIAFSYHLIEVAKVKEFAQKALELSFKIGYTKGKAWANIYLGVHHYLIGNITDALTYYEIGFDLASQIEDYEVLTSVSCNLGLYYQDFEELGKAMEWYLKGTDYAEKANRFSSKATILNNIGNMFVDNLNDDKGKYYYK